MHVQEAQIYQTLTKPMRLPNSTSKMASCVITKIAFSFFVHPLITSAIEKLFPTLNARHLPVLISRALWLAAFLPAARQQIAFSL